MRHRLRFSSGVLLQNDTASSATPFVRCTSRVREYLCSATSRILLAAALVSFLIILSAFSSQGAQKVAEPYEGTIERVKAIAF
jgi:hypothetical protein